MYKIAVLMACYNRCSTTLDCLRRLFLAAEQYNEVDLAVFLVDDGSQDGTGASVHLEFPKVNVIHGDGTLYWANGMKKAWEVAVEQGEWDGYLWLNDDAVLCRDAIRKLLAVNNGRQIVVGDLEDAEGKVIYGLREGGVFTGNCVLVPHEVFGRLGMICGDYAHAWADSDYAMMAKHANVGVVSAGVVGMGRANPIRPSLKGVSLRDRIALLRNPKGWNLHDLWLYRRRNWGLCAAIASCVHLIAHVIIGE